jgi:tetratricopeptide (TPR) repeat protein
LLLEMAAAAMPGPYLRGLATLAAAAAFWAVPAAAQSLVDPVAIQLKKTGDVSIENGRFDEALSAYTKALAIEPTAALHFNRGRALQALGRNAEALEEFDRFLSESTPELRAAVPELSAMVRLVRGQISEVVVRCDVPGALLHFGPKVLPLPLQAPLRFDPGTVNFEVTATGYESWQIRRTLRGGESAELVPELKQIDSRAHLTITSPVVGAQVQVDGSGMGTVPLELQLAPGDHAIVLQHEGYATANSRVVLRARDKRSLSVNLDPLPSWYQRWWFWSGVGAVVVTGVVVGVALSTEKSAGAGDIPPGRITSALVRW